MQRDATLSRVAAARPSCYRAPEMRRDAARVSSRRNAAGTGDERVLTSTRRPAQANRQCIAPLPAEDASPARPSSQAGAGSWCASSRCWLPRPPSRPRCIALSSPTSSASTAISSNPEKPAPSRRRGTGLAPTHKETEAPHKCKPRRHRVTAMTIARSAPSRARHIWRSPRTSFFRRGSSPPRHRFSPHRPHYRACFS